LQMSILEQKSSAFISMIQQLLNDHLLMMMRLSVEMHVVVAAGAWSSNNTCIHRSTTGILIK